MHIWLNEQWIWFKGFLSESDGKASSKRLISILVAVTFLASYSKNVVMTSTLPDIPVTWAMLLAGILGLSIVAAHFAKKDTNGAPNGG